MGDTDWSAWLQTNLGNVITARTAARYAKPDYYAQAGLMTAQAQQQSTVAAQQQKNTLLLLGGLVLGAGVLIFALKG